MSLSTRLLIGAALAVAGATGTSAQNISNEIWLGQIGATNTITIDQSGRNNQAGADNIELRLNQDGSSNILVIEQFGHHNKVGATLFDGPPTGINQVGDSNVIEIEQRTARDAISDGGNVIGAIFQQSAYVLMDTANSLTILQSESGGNGGAANHGVRTVRQIHTGGSGDPNKAEITQVGGGLGEGNVLGDLYQHGADNHFALIQRNQNNEVIDVRQTGRGNDATIEQGLFNGIIGGNLIEHLEQSGFGNVSNVVMLGSNNAVQRILQLNEHLGPAAIGNSVSITLGSEDSGSTGNGSVGDFISAAARAVSTAQADIVQIGDYNRATITITGTDNRFGTRQTGEDNDVIVSIGALDGKSAERNESAVFQSGTGNYSSHVVLGSDNVGTARQFGDDNWLAIEQRGHGNLAEVVSSGNRINFDGVGFTGLAASVFPSIDLKPGRLYQEGIGNVISVSATGDDNRFGLHQAGNSNLAESVIIGSDSQVVILQFGNGNTSRIEQYGSRNSAVIRQ